MWGNKVAFLVILTGLFFTACILSGTVHIPYSDIISILSGDDAANPIYKVIILGTRLPGALTAMLAGAALAISGLIMQTTFDNPLAGPSVLGVSTGSSLGVAVVMLGIGGTIGSLSHYAAVLIGALIGAMAVLAVLLVFSRLVRNPAVLLIVGVMIGYLASSAVSLLNFFSTQEGVHSFVIWGMGSFNGVSEERLWIFAIVTMVLVIISFLMVKPLDAMLLGENYAANLGLKIKRTRSLFLLISGSLTAVVTAFCGPIGFIGLVVPHVARYFVGTARHGILLPSTALCGAWIALMCLFISSLPSNGIIPLNAITPIIGVPVIIYILMKRHD